MTEYPLSPAQQAIWFEDQVDPGAGNTGFFSVTLVGELREELVAAACAAAVSRHTTMRTILRTQGEQPFLEVLPATTPLRYETAAQPCAPGEETAATRDWRDRHGMRRFDLTAGPPVTFTLLRHGPDRRSLLVVAHHIGYDGRSKFVFARTFAAALTDLRAGRVPESSALPWPDWPTATDEAMAAANDYWQAAGVESYPPLRLPQRGTTGERTIGTTGEVFIDGSVRDRLAKLAEAHGVSLFAVMLAGLAITLHGYGNTRMVLCAPVDVTTAQTRDLIGLGVNIVPFTLSVDGDDTVASVLAKTAAVRGHLKAYGAVPFQLLSVGKGWSAGSRALFSRLAVSYMRMATDVPEVPGLVTRWDFVAHNTARTFDLMIHMRDAYDRLVIRLDHAGLDLDAHAAAAIAAHLRGVLAGLPDRPSIPLSALDLMPAESTKAGPPVNDGDLPQRWLARHLGLARGDSRVLQLAPAGSPQYSLECWLAQAGDGTLYAPGTATPAEAIREYAITTVAAPYRILRDLARSLPATLRDVITPMADLRPTAEIVAMVRAGVRLHALYTDARGTPVAVQTCSPDDLAGGYTPILRDLVPGTRISVSDRYGHTLPYGIIGDLVITSTGREHSGDLAAIDRTGTIRFHGAAAQTVEWAGQRLEIPAIERYLMAHPDVDDAVVVSAARRPVAYLVPRADRSLDDRAARLHLKRRSVPGEPRLARVHVVSRLPRLPDGEVDRDALAADGADITGG